MKPLWIGTSWKMNKTLAEALAFVQVITKAAAPEHIQRFLIPSFTTIRQVKEACAGTDVLVGAQNMHWQDDGAWTGEVSPVMLKDCNMDLVELGHSERRTHFGENDETVGKKVAAAIQHGLIPLICIGETAEQKDAGRTGEVLEMQIHAALKPVAGRSETVLLAYEPVWAIGDGGSPASPDYAQAQHAEIKAQAEKIMGRDIPCLYGGSVNPSNALELGQQSAIDGLFIGRAAWNADGYLSIIRNLANRDLHD